MKHEKHITSLEKMRLDLNEQLYRADQVILISLTQDEPKVNICLDDLTPQGYKNLSEAFCELGLFLAKHGCDQLGSILGMDLDDSEEDLDG